MAEAAEESPSFRRDKKSTAAFRTISEVAAELNLPQHVLRFWETKFPTIRPLKRGGGRRYYRPEDVVLLRGIRDLLYDDGYTIKGVQKLLRQNGAKGLAGAGAVGQGEDEGDPTGLSLTEDKRSALEAVVADLEDLRNLLSRRVG